MQTLSLSQLTDTQLAQVRYLFADHAFGTDAGAYVYEVDKLGEVKGRRTADDRPLTTERAKQGTVMVTVFAEVNITEQMISQMKSHMDALAVSIAQKLNQSQQVEQGASNV